MCWQDKNGNVTRCSNYLNKDAYNAARRARYQSKRNTRGYIVNQTNNIVETNPLITDLVVDGFWNPFGVEEEPYEVDDKLNIKKVKCFGDLAEQGYLSETIVSGTLDYENLDEESYKKFFPEVTYPDDDFRPTPELLYDQLVLQELSKLELSKLTPEEKAAIRYFTSPEYEVLNNALYHNEFDEEAGEDNSSQESFFSGKALDPSYSFYDSPTVTPSVAKEIIDTLDSALEKSPKKQRRLYRGVKSGSRTFGGNHNKWINNLSLGQEMVFDGYQSATQFPDSAQAYCAEEGVVFEILTPEGLQVSSVSVFAHEIETLLPRNARYAVVGIHKDYVSDEEYGIQQHLVQLIAINSKGEILDGTNSDPIEKVKF